MKRTKSRLGGARSLSRNSLPHAAMNVRQANRDGVWHGYTGGPEPADESHTGVEAERLAALLRKLSEVPASFRLHPKLERGMKARRQMADGEHPLDWAAAEALAFATLATEGVRIRLSGQ